MKGVARLGWLDKVLGRREAAAAAAHAAPLYAAIVARGRAAHWYVEGQVPDTVDGRFDMIASVLSMVLLRLEAQASADAGAAEMSARLTERFVEDMDGQLRQMGIGDVVVGKHVGRMMSMLGGRIGAYREGLEAGPDAFAAALVRNLWRGAAPADAAVAHVEHALRVFRAALAPMPVDALERGELP